MRDNSHSTDPGPAQPGSSPIAPGIHRLGLTSGLPDLMCNAYLLLDGDEAVLVDPGSVLDFDTVLDQLTRLVPLAAVKWIILSHQDPDLASSVPLFERAGFTGRIACHWRAGLLLRYYGIRSPFYHVDQEQYRLQLAGGRELHFLPTPFLHSPGAIATWDPRTGTLFSADLFGAFSQTWTLYAEPRHYAEAMKAFHEHYVPSHELLARAMDRLALLDIRLIAPQHGSVIREDIPDLVNLLRNMEVGQDRPVPGSQDLEAAGGYAGLVTRVLKRWADIFGGGAVLQLCDSTGIYLNPSSLAVDSFEGSAGQLWERIFDLALGHRDASWLSVCEELVRHLALDYGIPLPAAFGNRLSWLEQQRRDLQQENSAMRETQLDLDRKLQQIQEQLIRDPLTGMYNEAFHERYIRSELAREDVFAREAGFLYVSLDRLGDINNRYGDSVGDEALKAVAVTILGLVPKGAVCFRLQAAVICIYLRGAGDQAVRDLAELLRSRVESSEFFIEKMTVSVAIVLLDEYLDHQDGQEALFELIRNAGRARLQWARSQGMNTVCAETPRLEDDHSRPLVLVADPDILMLDVLTRSLTAAGYRVLRYQDGPALWQAIHDTDAALVIAELFLPQLDAFGVRDRMQGSPDLRDIPFILVSHRKDDATVQRSTGLGIEHYLKKPFFLNEMIGIVGMKLGRQP